LIQLWGPWHIVYCQDHESHWPSEGFSLHSLLVQKLLTNYKRKFKKLCFYFCHNVKNYDLTSSFPCVTTFVKWILPHLPLCLRANHFPRKAGSISSSSLGTFVCKARSTRMKSHYVPWRSPREMRDLALRGIGCPL